MVKYNDISVTAIGSYSSGSLMAYAVLSAPIGGIPAFYVNGLALGFGYNKRLSLPSIEEVPDYPLVSAAVNGFNANIQNELKKYLTSEKGTDFLAAGVKFTSFGVVKGFMLFTVSFGNKLDEIGALGLADISVPPMTKSNPVAKAQLAIKVDFAPSRGFFSAEAQLTSESYILSKDCHLRGGFAAYYWFGSNEKRGDFVVSLGGYHPAYKRPAHYPIVPRLELNWNVTSSLNITGEMYFALVPNVMMGRQAECGIFTGKTACLVYSLCGYYHAVETVQI
jgi:hypothetical protein